jgi:hypothetical protein
MPRNLLDENKILDSRELTAPDGKKYVRFAEAENDHFVGVNSRLILNLVKGGFYLQFTSPDGVRTEVFKSHGQMMKLVRELTKPMKEAV